MESLRQKLGGQSPTGKKIFWSVVIGIAFIIWIFSGFYMVGPDEQGVEIRFGEFVATTGPGPHIHLPFPIERVVTPKVTQVQRIEVGYRTRGRNAVDVPAESLMLTGDENIIDIDLAVQYRIKDAGRWLFNVREPSKAVRNAVESAIRMVIGNNSIDQALTSGKETIQAQTKEVIQTILDSYEAGIEIMSVQLQQVAAPKEVVQAFKDVASAREDRERAINEAQGYANDILPKASGEAARLVQEAEAYKASKVARAQGEVQRFQSLLTQYEKAPSITQRRLYLETMEEVLSKVNKVVLGNESSHGVLPYLPLQQGGSRVVEPARQPAKGGG